MESAESSLEGRTPAWRKLLAIALAFASVWALIGLTRARQFDGRWNSDEPEWVAISILHWRQLTHGGQPAGADLQEKLVEAHRSEHPWAQGVHSTMFGHMNPGLPKVALGAALSARGFREASPYVFQVFNRDEPSLGARAHAELFPARETAVLVVSLFAAASGVLLMLAMRSWNTGAAGWIAAGVAAALWIAAPIVRHTSHYIRTDHFMLPWCVAALAYALRRVDALDGSRGARKTHEAALVLGALSGLAVASKLNGALLGFTVAAWFVVLQLRARGVRSLARRDGPLAAAALAGGVATAVFVLFNPRLWTEPVVGVRDMLARWSVYLDKEKERWGFGEERSTLEGLRFFTRELFERTDAPGEIGGAWLSAALTLAGAGLLATRAFSRNTCRERASRATIVLAYCAVMLLGGALWMPWSVGRFYLPTTPCLVVLQACAVAWAFDAAARRWRRAGS